MPLTATRYEFKDDPPRYSCDKDEDNTYSRVWCYEVSAPHFWEKLGTIAFAHLGLHH